MNKLFYPAVFQPEQEGGFSVFFPDLDGCNTQGDTIEESYSMAFDALGIVLSYMEDEGIPIPKASAPQQIALEEGQYIVVIEFDMMEYKKKTGSQAVKKTLSIPSWLNVEAEKAGINFSAVLQSALKEQLGL
ncbi:MAG TPA: type II toxin-antitoxin system HicB family antitoxin [Bacillota bacterium]|nr:type II toxin-antitoxin system HicB family antitoxin [Bacillota bacterium]